MNNETLWLIVFVALTSFALLVQAIVMMVVFFTLRKTVSALQADVQEIKASAIPVLTKSKETLDKVAPRLESIAADVADLTKRFREQGIEVQATAAEILDRIHRQTSRVDNMFTNVIDGVEHASDVVANSVARPVRQVSAVLASVKAFLSVLTTGRRPERQVDLVADQDMFV